MENIKVQEKPNKTGVASYSRNKTRTYTKVQDDIYDLFEEAGIRLTYRMVYMALSGCLIPNSEFARATFKKLRAKSGASSDQTISMAIKELSQKGFISKMGGSTYRLWHCVYKGIRENEKEYSEVKESTTPSVVTTTTPSVVPHAGVILFSITKEQQHETDDVSFKNLSFEEGSPFKTGVPIWQWMAWIEQYKFEWCQKMITELEHSYQKSYGSIKFPVKLMAKALKMGKVWQLERKRLDDAKNFEKDRERQKAQEKLMALSYSAERAEMDTQNEKDDVDYAEATKQPYLIDRVLKSLGECGRAPRDGSDCDAIILRYQVIKKYRESLK